MFNFKSDERSKMISMKFRFYSFKTLTELGLKLLQNTYASERSERVVQKVHKFHLTILNFLQLGEVMQDVFQLILNRTGEQHLMVECASELIFKQLKKASRILLKEYKKPII